MSDDFFSVIGAIIHQCGVLEFFTNSTIRRLSSDTLLSSRVVKSGLSNRIDILRELLQREAKLNPEDITSLCNELKEISKLRNAVAHNPIAMDESSDPQSAKVLVLRHHLDAVHVDEKELGISDLKEIGKRTSKAIERFRTLIPSCVEVK